MTIACEELSRNEKKKASLLLETISKEIINKREKGYDPSAVLLSIDYYALLMSAFANEYASPIRSDIYYSSCYGVRVFPLFFVHKTFFEVVCRDEPMLVKK